MANTDFGILLKTLLDKSGINSELEQVQKIVNKYSIDIMPELKTASLRNQMKAVSQEIANDFNKAFGTNLTGNDVFKAFENQAKQAEKAVKEEAKAIEVARKEQESLTNAMAKGREQAELSRQAEQKRQQMAQNNAINKALEQEYQERQKNIEAARKQAELDKQNALAFTKSASERLSSAISKYSYGDTSDANAMMKQMNRGLSNFGDLSNVQGNITQLSATVDKIIADLKLSHEQSLQALNEEIKAEQTLQSQKDAFNKKNINAIDYEIQKREEEAKAFSSMLQAQMQEQQKMQSEVNKIQLSFDDGTYEAKYDSLIAKTRQWINANDESVISTQRLTTAYNEFNQAATAYAKDGSVANRDKLIQKEEELARQIKATTNEVRSQNAEYAKSSKIDSLHQRIQEFYDKNTAAHKKWGSQLKNMLNETAHGAQLTATRVNEIEQEFLGVGNAARQAGKLGDSFFGGIKKQAGQFLQWFSVTSVIMEGVQQVRKMVNEVKTLDNAMMDLTMATGYNKSQIEDLMDTYFKLGDKLSATASDVAASADTWLRQGKSIAETNKLIEDSMVLSKIGGLSSEDSTKYLTSVMKGYKVATEDVIGVVDKLSAVDMASATDVGGLAEGMSEVAASADLAGVSMDKLLGYLATIGEVTQSGMSEVGTTLNAVFARMGNIKLSRLKDYETGEDLSNVETVLRGVGINLRDSMNSFRDFDEVLDETASNWNNYSEVQQRAIAQAFSGTHHMNEFIILMENYDTALKYTETSLGSTGQAMEKFEAYEESIAGHTEKFKNAFQDLSNSVIDSGLINFFIDLGTTGIKAVDGLVDALGGLGAIGAIGGGILGAKNIGKVYECTFSNCFEYALHT